MRLRGGALGSGGMANGGAWTMRADEATLRNKCSKVRVGPSAESTPLGGAAPQISLRSAAPCSPRTKVTPMHLFLALLEDGGQISVLRLMLKQEIYIYTFTYIHTYMCVCVCVHRPGL